MKNTVAIPAAGENAYLYLSLAAMATLHAEFGDDYVKDCWHRLDLCDPRVIRVCLDSMLVDGNGDIHDILRKMPVSELTLLLGDAISLSIFGEPLKLIQAEMPAA
jgi:hypothetical protein